MRQTKETKNFTLAQNLNPAERHIKSLFRDLGKENSRQNVQKFIQEGSNKEAWSKAKKKIKQKGTKSFHQGSNTVKEGSKARLLGNGN